MNTTSKEPTASPQSNTKSFVFGKKTAAEYVAEMLRSSRNDWQSITITPADSYGASYVTLAISSLSEDTETPHYLMQLRPTSVSHPQAGSYPQSQSAKEKAEVAEAQEAEAQSEIDRQHHYQSGVPGDGWPEPEGTF